MFSPSVVLATFQVDTCGPVATILDRGNTEYFLHHRKFG